MERYSGVAGFIIPDKLYHATYEPLVTEIQSSGLGGDRSTVWSDSIRGTVYLAIDPEIALSYAETSDQAWDKFEINGSLKIVIFEIDATRLNQSLFYLDQNVLDSRAETLEYRGIIPPVALKIFRHETV